MMAKNNYDIWARNLLNENIYAIDDANLAGNYGMVSSGNNVNTIYSSTNGIFGIGDSQSQVTRTTKGTAFDSRNLEANISRIGTFENVDGTQQKASPLLEALARYRKGRDQQQSLRNQGLMGSNSILGGGAF